MRNFTNILYVSRGTTEEAEGLKQALSLARNNKASLKVLVACPELPKKMIDFTAKYEESLLQQINASIEATRSALDVSREDVDIVVELVTDDKPSVRIVQEVLRGGHDLLVKEAETQGRVSGFRAIDMAILRKCPSPVWLCRPIKRSRKDIRVAVAIDPESEQEAARALSRQMLQLSRSLADSCSSKLHIVSCWDFKYESFLRHSPWSRISERQIADSVTDARDQHRQKLDVLIDEGKLTGAQEIHYLRGSAEEQIPAFIEDKSIDILVMGTVARTGIASFSIGNTAENILQKLTCSLIALKPKGFVSTVKAYD
ncbi:MAG: universal stress protein [Pseudohongiellaceae bacterium]